MQIEIQAVDFALTEGLRTHLLYRLNFALWRFQDRIARVTVRLSDRNGPRGGVDKVCCLRMRLHGMPDVVIEATEADLYVAISRAADRAGRTAGRQMERARGEFEWGKEMRHERTE